MNIHKILPIFLLLFFGIHAQGNISASEDHKLDSLIIVLNAAKEDTAKVNTLNALCRKKMQMEEYADAKKHADAALSLAKKLGFKKGMAISYHQIGNIYWYLPDFSKALVYNQKALDLFKELGDKHGIAISLNRIGHDYADLSNYPKALVYFQEALALNEQIGNRVGVSSNLDLIGYVYMNLLDYPKALAYYQKALKIDQEIGNKMGLASTYSDIGVVYEKQGKLANALLYEKKGLSITLEGGSKLQLRDIYAAIEKISLKMKNFPEAYNARLKFDEINHAIASSDNAGKVKQMQMQYDFDRTQDSTKAVQAKMDAITKAEIETQKTARNGFIVGFVLVLVLVGVIYNRYHLKQKSNAQLAKTLQELKDAQQQLIKSERMAAFGVMASRVAHEIQNPLNFVTNYSQLSGELLTDTISAETEEEKQEAVRVLSGNLQKINYHGKRADDIVKLLVKHINEGTSQEFFEEGK